mmetsp:Transcript_4675/g.14111  ORF Transcript_4675/g.14111 Transcript_4675/m.14111 type:complete len:224 (-) Transcript_4675:421-1092(-)
MANSFAGTRYFRHRRLQLGARRVPFVEKPGLGGQPPRPPGVDSADALHVPRAPSVLLDASQALRVRQGRARHPHGVRQVRDGDVPEPHLRARDGANTGAAGHRRTVGPALRPGPVPVDGRGGAGRGVPHPTLAAGVLFRGAVHLDVDVHRGAQESEELLQVPRFADRYSGEHGPFLRGGGRRIRRRAIDVQHEIRLDNIGYHPPSNNHVVFVVGRLSLAARDQ